MPDNDIAAIVIGRNEGSRLKRCLTALAGAVRVLIYVDSGSTDDSVRAARKIGAEIVELDMSIPFTAARARNAGFDALQSRPDKAAFNIVQFVDGDCEIIDDWIDIGRGFLAEQETVGIVYGRLIERSPGSSVYNLMCNMEWDLPVGEVSSCGGNAMMRVAAFKDVGGYNASMIAGEEPELCYRIRQKGWRIFSLEENMVIHEADIAHFFQWWKRAVRSGNAYAEGHAMHGEIFSGYRAKTIWSIFIWAFVLPIVIIGFAQWTGGLSVFFLCGYGLLWWRIRKSKIGKKFTPFEAGIFAMFSVVGKFAQLIGVIRYWTRRVFRRDPELIEYK